MAEPPGEPSGSDDLWARLRSLPKVDEPPLPEGWGRGADRPDRPLPPPPPGPPPGPASAVPAGQQWFVPADAAAPPLAPPSPTGPSPTGPPPGRPPTPPPGAPGGPGGPPPRARRRRPPWGRIAVIAALVVAIGLVGFLVYGLVQFQRIDRVDLDGALSGGGGGTNYLIVGSDSREGVDPNDPNAGALLGDDSVGSGQRSDTLLVLRIADDGARMMSIPRDLWVTRADGGTGRINAAFRDGPPNVVRTVRSALGLPIHHYVEVDFVTFAGLVDAVGGVTIEIPHPARDDASGLNLPTAGLVELDGTQALAFVRSRRYTELIDGQWRTDPTGDLGRVQRQQQFLRAVMGEVGGARNPIELARIASAVSGGLRIDDTMGFFDALSFARRMRGLDPETVVLPTVGANRGGASVLDLVQPDATAALVRMGASG
ncbi:MAG TPA: LCP family protein [Acidimicrobiales bacterium]|nr:LCP family protein [Acidimicrobiales bacterium]